MKKYSFAVLALLVASLCSSCAKEEVAPIEEEEVIVPGDDPGDSESENELILINDEGKRQQGYVLLNDPGNGRVYLMDKDTGEPAFEWELPYALGNDAKLEEDGSLIASMRSVDPFFTFGGYGGELGRISPEGSLDWSFALMDETLIGHHDIAIMPNGNLLTLVWNRSSAEEAATLGYAGAQEVLYTESVVEIDPDSNTVVWLWDSRDHLVQDSDPELGNYGNVGSSPNKIDVNYRDEAVSINPDNGDIMHANAVVYDAESDLIYISVNYFSEVWVIDHSADVEEVKTGAGGNYGLGGDLVYRFGNPQAYRNEQGERLFFNNHSPNFVEDTGHMLVFVNGNNTEGPSVVYELNLPDVFELEAGADNEPEVVWDYSHPEMYSAKVSGAQRLPNGNTLITIGTLGCWEVTPDKEVVWQFQAEGFFWRGYHIDKDAPEVNALGI